MRNPWIIRKLSLFLAIFSCIESLTLQAAQAQEIIPAADGTMTVVTPEGNRFTINGGTLSGDGRNLFHSFQEFGLSAEQIATFLSNPSIVNILSRVTGGNASIINGTIEVVGGNSNLFLMNPAGIIFGAGASLNVPADFTATTATGIGLNGGWFQAFGTNDYVNLVGNPNGFGFQSGSAGAIINAGDLAVKPGQNLSLLGGTVINTGTLQAPGGNITITAVPGTGRVRLSQDGHLLSLEIKPPKTESGEVLPVRGLDLPELLTGTDGQVETGLQVTASGQVKLTESGTTIPTHPGTSIVSGRVDTSSASALGGEIRIFGDRVGLIGANLDASGQTGGGTVLIGGDYKGQGTVPNAQVTVVDKNSKIQANALENGNGGRTIVWADETTAFSGKISARGGENAGNGGFVEISGQENLSFQGRVDVSASNGSEGTLLLDPTNIFIVDGSGGGNDAQLSDGQILAGDGATETFTISETALEQTNGNVILEATNNITIDDLIDNQLDLSSDTIAFKADADGNQVGAFSMNSGDTIVTQAGDVTLSGASLTVGLINTRGTSVTGGNVNLTANGAIALKGLDSLENSVVGRSIIINTPGTLSVAGSLNARNDGTEGSGNVTIGNTLAPSSITVGTISTRNLGGGNGGNIFINTTGSLNVTDAFLPDTGNPGDPNNPNDISIGSEANGKGGNINITAGGSITTAAGIYSDSTTSGNGGNITLTSGGDITTGRLDSSAETQNAGAIALTSKNGAINLTGIVDSTSVNGKGGAVNLTAANNISTGTIVTSSQAGNGGNITLNSQNGAINTTSGSSLTAQEIQEILGSALQLKNIQDLLGLISGAAANGGKISLTAQGNITTANLLSSSLAQGQGGAIALNSNQGIIDTTAAQNFSLSSPLGVRPIAGIDSSSSLGSGQGTLQVSATNFTVSDNIFTDGDILIKSPVTVRDDTTMNAGQGGITVEKPIVAIGSASVALTAEKNITISDVTTGVPEPEDSTFSVQPAANGQQLADFILGAGITISKVKFVGATGETGSAGIFRGGKSAGLGIEKGIILTSGQATLALGPNNDEEAGASNGLAGDSDLDALVPEASTNDATVVEITFDTKGGKISLNYVFASEEYNEFVNQEFNDVVGIFVDGNNIALVPGTNTPVAINNVNSQNNSALYNNNAPSDFPGQSTPFNNQYDGFTKVLTASSPDLDPGSHTIKLAIADVGDTELDSAVFIEGGSLGATSTNVPGNITIESTNGSVSTGNLSTASSSQANGGAIAIDAATTINTGTINTSSTQGNGGNITLTSEGDLKTGRLDSSAETGNAGAIALTSNNGAINLTGIVDSTSVNGKGGAVNLTAANNISTGTIVTSSQAGNGGNITLNSQNGAINTTSGSSLTAQEIQEILGSAVEINNIQNLQGLISGAAVNGGKISLTAQGNITTANLLSSSLAQGQGGAIALTSNQGIIDTTAAQNFSLSSPLGVRQIAGIDSSSSLGSGQGTLQVSATNFTVSDNIFTDGDILIKSPVTVRDDTTMNAGQGGITVEKPIVAIGSASVALTAEKNISISDVTTGAPEPEDSTFSVPGNLTLESTNGSVSTGNLSTASSSQANGGAIAIDAATTINTGTINTSSTQGNGGNITLNSSGDIQVNSINAQGGSLGTGGDVNVTTDQFFRATGTFTDQNNIAASISTAGGAGGGAISISHGGNGVTPFIVGDASINGTAGAITTGTSTIDAGSFPFTETRGNISLLSVENPLVALLQEAQQNNDPTSAEPTPATQLSVTTPPPVVPVATIDQAKEIIQIIEQESAAKPALIYVNFTPPGVSLAQDFARQEASLTSQYEGHLDLPQNKAQPTLLIPPSATDELELLAITSEGEPIRVRVPGATRELVLQTAAKLYDQVSNLGDDYLASSQQLYQWLIAPIEAELKARGVENFLFMMPEGLRLVPIAALHDGQKYVAQKYSTGFAPSLNLIDYRYRSIKDSPVLALGASQFEADQNQTDLPAVQIEVPLISSQIRRGKSVLDKDFTLENLVENRQDNPYPIIHLATHADFQPGELSKSYIQLYNQKIGLNELRELGLNKPTVDLLVISACRSAYGDKDAELGFAGLAVQAGVKSAIASLWYVGDTGTLALMSDFYRQLETAPIKAEALRLAQVDMIEGRLKKQGDEIISTRGAVPLPEEATTAQEDLTHPFYWAAFTMIGSPW